MELFRLLRKAEEPWLSAVGLTFVAYVTGTVAEAKHATMEHLLGVCDGYDG